ncbi:penicillin-binding protein 1A [Dongshaea marina]|uniref:penicillin-binding protein 1A n=1 Tax=Dongshaea marina TaxID=2047966 RepID=UPI000D3EDAFB|nr:PBP1A family penicillin-binding protein [Dongshaea marina]
MLKFCKRLIIFCLTLFIIGVIAVVGIYFYLKPTLPDVSTLKDVHLETPMKVYSADGQLISQFGEKRRIPLHIEQIPQPMIDAFLATEDNRFYEHPGIDPIGIIRAAWIWMVTGQKRQGASTITQQVARNFFLTRDKTITRKVKEIFLAWHIEQLLTKNEILELYLNKIPLGYRAFGVGAAAQVYYGKTVKELTLPQIAMIAGLPKAPSALNPLSHPIRAKERRDTVLERMLETGKISEQQYRTAIHTPLTARYHGAEITLHAPYLAEMVRQWMVDRYGEKAYTEGFNVYTTVYANRQRAAQDALHDGLFAYDMRHGYRGAVKKLWDPSLGESAWPEQKINDYLKRYPHYKPLEPAIVTQVDEKSAQVIVKGAKQVTLGWNALKWARAYIDDEHQGNAPKQASDVLQAGELIWVRPLKDGSWQLSEIPQVNAAIVSVNPTDGAIQALVGGFNFYLSKFNRAEQALRQIGSNIKPFIYSAALDSGFTLASMVNDAPLSYWDPSLGVAWRPKNDNSKYSGLTRLRVALGKSLNVVSVRLLQSVGLDRVLQRLEAFGFPADQLPHASSIALGSASLTPLQVVAGFSAFANGGFKVNPYFIRQINNGYGQVVYEANPKAACSRCSEISQQQLSPEHALNQDGDWLKTCAITPVTPFNKARRILSPQTAFLISDAMRSAIWGGGSWKHHTAWTGTGWRTARALKRHDISGKTGTTNESRDAWFSGFNPDLVTTVWIGFDNHDRKLGKTRWNPNMGQGQIVGGEYGANAAQPIWIDYMKEALKGVPEQAPRVPQDVVSVRIDRATGQLSRKSDYTSMFEYFKKGTAPTRFAETQSTTVYQQQGQESEKGVDEAPAPLF